MSVKCLGYRA